MGCVVTGVMGLFGSSDDDNGESKHGTDQEETVEVERTDTKEYTEHTAVAEFTDGDTREVTFDSMDDGEGKIVLKNYTGAYLHKEPGYIPYQAVRFAKQTFLTIPHDNLKTFETMEREKKEMEYTYTEEVPKSEAGTEGE